MKKENKKNIYKVFRFCSIFLFITFLTLYFSMVSGFYEYNNHEKMIFTSEQIKKFEKDVKEGKEIDITNYIETKNTDYQNSLSKLGLNLSNFISTGINTSIEKFFEFLVNLIDE